MEKLHDLELKVLTNTKDVSDMARRMDSYHHDSKLRHDKLESMISALPDEDKIFKLFTEQAEKLARGLIKRDDEQEKRLDEYTDRLTIVQNEITTTKKAFKWALALVTTIGGILGIKGLQ